MILSIVPLKRQADLNLTHVKEPKLSWSSDEAATEFPITKTIMIYELVP